MKRFASLVVLTLTFGLFPNALALSTFPDVSNSHLNAEAIEYLQETGIIDGYPDGEYKPSNKINRAEFTKILIGAITENPTGDNCFSDVQEEWFAKYVCEAKAQDIIGGYPDGTFRPNEEVNFSEAAKIIANTYDLEASDIGGERWYKEYIEALEEEKVVPFSVNFFDEEITRDEMAEMVWRLKADVQNKATRTYNEIIGEGFITVNSCAEMNERIKAINGPHGDYGAGFGRGFEGDMFMLEEAAPADAVMKAPEILPATSANKTEASDDYSTTNLQVVGVDEADIIKNDGQHIYIIKSGTIRIVEAYPANNMKELVTLSLGDENEDFWPNEMYVDENRLIIVGSMSRNERLPAEDFKTIIAPSYQYVNRTKLYILDITDRSNPSVERSVEFDGNYNTSRKVNDTLYMVVNKYPDHYRKEELISDNDKHIPRMRDSQKGVDEMVVGCGDIMILPKTDRVNFLVTAAVPLANVDAEIVRNVIVGDAENIYASRSNMYITATDWSGGYWRDNNDTAIYRFALGINSMKFEKKGKVPGRVLNQFSMDEHRDHFRIATTTNNVSDNITNNLYVLDQDMNLVGDLENIAPGESIFSVRFMGDKAYMVTFKRVDPLFVIGLSDPTDPKILGELKIPGFSNYLHPYDENHLIGFGKSVDPGDSSIADEDFVLWDQIQGLKMGMFDVTDVNNPKELFTEVIGDQGTNSELLNNHKALLLNKEKELLALPISVYEYQDVDNCQDYRHSNCPSSCQKICVPSTCTFENGLRVCTADCDGRNSCAPPVLEYGQKVYEGAYVYNVNLEDGFTFKGRINHHNDSDLLNLSEAGWVDASKMIKRIIYIGENLYTISRNGVKASALSDLEELNFIELAGSVIELYPEPIIF